MMPVSPSYVGIRSWPGPGATSGTAPPKSWAVAVISPPPVAKNVTTTFVDSFDGRAARAAQMACGASAARRDGVPRGPSPRGRPHGRDEMIASVSGHARLVVGRELNGLETACSYERGATSTGALAARGHARGAPRRRSLYVPYLVVGRVRHILGL